MEKDLNNMISISDPEIDENEIRAVTKVLKTHNIAQGKKVFDFEKKFSKFCGSKYAIATNNGTSALHTTLYTVGIKENDQVITTPFTFVATANAILMVGAKPSFVDINPETYNIDPSKIEKAITKKTKAIIVVDLYGQPADFDEINKIANKYNLLVIEDAAQSVNAEYNNKKSGNLADISCFSFYATKNITCGEGGAITTNNEKFYLKAKQFINHGQTVTGGYDYIDIGYNYRMTNIQAAILLEQLKKVHDITKIRQRNAQRYNKAFKNVTGLKIPYISSDVIHAFHQYTIRITNDFPVSRDNLISYLLRKNIQTKVYYPKLLFEYSHLKKISTWQDSPNAHKAAEEVLSLPNHSGLSLKDIDYIIDTISVI